MISNNQYNLNFNNNIEALRKEATALFQQGDTKFQSVNSIPVQEEGEQDPTKKSKLTEVYTDRYNKVELGMKSLREQKDKLSIQMNSVFMTNKQKTNTNNQQNQYQYQQQQFQPKQFKAQPLQQNQQNQQIQQNQQFQNTINDAILSEKPNVQWDDIGGLENAKEALKEAVIVPIKFPKFFQGALQPWKGILLYGPPGTGKTFLAKACATQANCTFISVSAADLTSKYVGETEKTIRQLFNTARSKKPSIIFIDECDSMFGERKEDQQENSRRAITEFLTQMQGVGNDDKGILVLGATNIPWQLDSAVRRRFEKRIYIPLPDETARQAIIQKQLEGTNYDIKKSEFQKLAKNTAGFSGSDINVLIKDAVYQPIRFMMNTNKFRKIEFNGQKSYIPVKSNEKGKDIETLNFMDISQSELEAPAVTYKDFEQSMKKCKPSVSKQQLQKYEQFTQEFGQEG